jgi:hypothetical protein
MDSSTHGALADLRPQADDGHGGSWHLRCARPARGVARSIVEVRTRRVRQIARARVDRRRQRREVERRVLLEHHACAPGRTPRWYRCPPSTRRGCVPSTRLRRMASGMMSFPKSFSVRLAHPRSRAWLRLKRYTPIEARNVSPCATRSPPNFFRIAAWVASKPARASGVFGFSTKFHDARPRVDLGDAKL